MTKGKVLVKKGTGKVEKLS